MKIVFLTFTTLSLVGCSSAPPLREDAKMVSITQRPADVASCKFIEATSVDKVIDFRYQPSEATQSLRNLAMNKSTELGGNTVLMGQEQHIWLPVTKVAADIKVYQCASAAANTDPK